jgi:hypothetical protein
MSVPKPAASAFKLELSHDRQHGHLVHHETPRLAAHICNLISQLPNPSGNFVFQLWGLSEIQYQRVEGIVVNKPEMAARTVQLNVKFPDLPKPVFGKLIIPKSMGDFTTVYEALRQIVKPKLAVVSNTVNGSESVITAPGSIEERQLHSLAPAQRLEFLQRQYPKFAEHFAESYLAWSDEEGASLIAIERWQGGSVHVAKVREEFLQSFNKALGLSPAFMAKVWRELSEGKQPVRDLGVSYYPINLRRWQELFDSNLDISVCTGTAIRRATDLGPVTDHEIALSQVDALASLLASTESTYQYLSGQLAGQERVIRNHIQSQRAALAALDLQRDVMVKGIKALEEELRALGVSRRDITHRQDSERAAHGNWQRVILG